MIIICRLLSFTYVCIRRSSVLSLKCNARTEEFTVETLHLYIALLQVPQHGRILLQESSNADRVHLTILYGTWRLSQRGSARTLHVGQKLGCVHVFRQRLHQPGRRHRSRKSRIRVVHDSSDSSIFHGFGGLITTLGRLPGEAYVLSLPDKSYQVVPEDSQLLLLVPLGWNSCWMEGLGWRNALFRRG